MSYDAHANLAVSNVVTAPAPATSGTSLVVTTGQGARFPAVPFNATVCPPLTLPTPANSEIVRVTNITGDTLTITRTQEGTSARTIVVGDQIAATITAKTLTDVETGVDVVSNALSVEISNRTSAVNVVSNAVSIVSQAVSVVSVAAALVSNNLSNEASIRAAADNVLSQQTSVLSQQLSVLSQRVSVASSLISVVSLAVTSVDTRVNTVSQQVSVLSQTVSAISQLLSTLRGGTTGQVLKKSANGDYLWTWAADATGGASSAGVTSNALSILSQGISVVSNALSNEISNRASAVNAVSNALSNETSNRISADNALSNSISNVLSAHDALSNVVSNSLSIGNAVSNAVSVLSQDVSVLSQAVSVLSQAHSALSQQVSVLSSQVSVVSVAVTSVDTRVNTVSNQVSIISQQVSVLSQTVSGISQLLSTLRGGTTGQVLKKSANADYAWTWAADATGGASSATVTSNALSIISQALSVLSQQTSVLSQGVSVVSQALSNEISNRISADNALSNSISNVLSAHNALSNVVSNAQSAGNVISNQVSIISQQVSVLSQNVSVLSQQVSVLSQLHSVLSQQVSVISAGIGLPQKHTIANLTTVSATAFTNVSGMSLSVTSAAVYAIEGQVMFTTSVVNTYQFGFTFPGGCDGVVKASSLLSIINAGDINLVSTNDAVGIQQGVGLSTVATTLLSATWGASATQYLVHLKGLVHVSATAGTIQLQAKASAAGGGPIFQIGSYLQAYRIA